MNKSVRRHRTRLAGLYFTLRVHVVVFILYVHTNGSCECHQICRREPTQWERTTRETRELTDRMRHIREFLEFAFEFDYDERTDDDDEADDWTDDWTDDDDDPGVGAVDV